MQKLNSFAEFSAAKAEINTAKLQEEQEAKRSKEAKTFTSLLSEYGVTAIKELDEDQKIEFFEKLRGAKVNEATELIEEGTRGQFGKIDKKGNIVSIYTHYDSYPENVLPLIKKGYKAGKNVDAVIKGGNSSGLEATPADMNFYKDGSKNLKGSIANVDGYLQAASDDGGAEYVYLWDEANKEWLMADIYGNRELVPAFESLSVSVNEAIKVEGKRDAKKVVTVYNRIFNKQLVDFGAMSPDSILGCVKYLFEQAMEDANFSREGFAISKNIKGAIKPLEIKMPGLGGHFVKIGPKTIKEILDKYYSDLANAAGWGGQGIVEGTALYLESLKQEAAGHKLLDAFNGFFNESLVIEESVVTEAKFDKKKLMKAMKADDGMIQLANGEEYIIYAYDNGNDENDAMWNDKSIFAVDQDGEEHEVKYSDIVSYNEAEIKSDEDFKEYAYEILKKAFGEEFDQTKADDVVNGILSKSDGDYGKAAGILQSSLA